MVSFPQVFLPQTCIHLSHTLSKWSQIMYKAWYISHRKGTLTRNVISLPIESSPLYVCWLQHVCKALCVSQDEAGKCIWYGQCFTDDKGKIKNCYNVTDPPVLTDRTGLEILKRRCPYIYNRSGKFQLALCGFLYACLTTLWIFTVLDFLLSIVDK